MAKYILRWLFTYEQSKCYSHVHINRNHVRLFWWPTTLYLEKLITASSKNLTHVAFSPDTVYDTFSDSFQQWRFSL